MISWPALGRAPGVDPERLDPEHRADHVPARAALVGVALDLVEPQQLEAARSTRVPQRRRARRDRCCRSPSTRSSRFSTAAQSSSVAYPSRASRSSISARSASSTGSQSAARRLPEQRVVEPVEAAKLLDGPLVVVDAEVDERVRQPRVAAVPLDDEQRRRLLAAAVAARGLRRGEAVDQPLGERPTGRGRERRRPARRPSRPRRGCSPAPRSRRPRALRPSRGTPRP